MLLDYTEEHGHRQLDSGVFASYKKRGETLRVFVERFRKEMELAEDVPITYAGRLDPMAEGVMIVLFGEACKRKNELLSLQKTYDFEVLFGFATDTHDMLGVITKEEESMVTKQEIEKALSSLKEITTFTYPMFSSKTVHGVPLFEYARKGIVVEKVPTKEGKIFALQLISLEHMPLSKIVKEAITAVEAVEGDFRQKEILSQWKEFESSARNVFVAKIICSVSSGVYVRTLVTMLGELLGAPALAYTIKRIEVK